MQEADKALLLLVEEGSSIAFPEATEQMRSDMLEVAERLTEAKGRSDHTRLGRRCHIGFRRDD
ncbi:MAG: hypothetical protein R3C28_19090 [Pirellulaceae bacterium]